MTFFFAFPARTNDFPNSRQTGKQIPRASRAQILVNPVSRKAVKSRFPSRYFASSRIPHRILVKSWIPKIPFHTLAKLQHSPANPATYAGYVRLWRFFACRWRVPFLTCSSIGPLWCCQNNEPIVKLICYK